MANFPSLKPSLRAFTPGDYPSTPYTAWNRVESRVRHSNVMLSSSLRLSFIGVSESQMLDVLTHYQAQLGGFYSFQLPSDVWSGVDTLTNYTLDGYQWRYTEPPSVTDLPFGGFNLDLSLATVPPECALATGMNASCDWSIASGSASVAASHNGLSATVTWSLSHERLAPGLTASITWSFDDGRSSDYYSNLATQVYSPLRDWSVDWWGD